MENIAWCWLGLGVILIILEILLPSFVALFFGVAALIVGGIAFLAPSMSLTAMCILFAVLSLVTIVVFFKFIKPKLKNKNHQEYMKSIGFITEAERNEPSKGRIRFSIPVMGKEEWVVASETDLVVGEDYEVVGFDSENNRLLVEKL